MSIDRISAPVVDWIYHYADLVPGDHVIRHAPCLMHQESLGESEESTNHIHAFLMNPMESKGLGFQNMIGFRYYQRPYDPVW
jgi:hypothetical protein